MKGRIYFTLKNRERTQHSGNPRKKVAIRCTLRIFFFAFNTFCFSLSCNIKKTDYDTCARHLSIIFLPWVYVVSYCPQRSYFDRKVSDSLLLSHSTRGSTTSSVPFFSYLAFYSFISPHSFLLFSTDCAFFTPIESTTNPFVYSRNV